MYAVAQNARPTTLSAAPRLPYKLSNTPSLTVAAPEPPSTRGLTPSGCARSMKNWEPHEDEILKRALAEMGPDVGP